MKTYNVKLEMDVRVQVADDITIEQAREIVKFEKDCICIISNKISDKMIDMYVVSYEVKK